MLKLTGTAWCFLISLILQGCALAAADSVVTFNEIHYHPADPAAPEWIELHSQMSIRTDLGGWTLRGGVNFTFPENTVMEPGALLVISSGAGLPSGAIGPFQGKLDNKGEEIRLHDRHGRLMDTMTYEDRSPWPHEADGGGPSLAKRQPDALSDEAANWSAGAQNGGTPGAENFPETAETAPRFIFTQGADWRLPPESPPPAEWTQPDFDDAAWSSGTAPLSTAAGPGPVTSLPAGRPAYYLRRSFAWTGGLAAPRLLLTGALTGNAVFYLNGAALPAVSGHGDFATALPADSLLPGANVLAVSLEPAAPGAEVTLDLALALIDGETGMKSAPSPHVAGPVVINEISYHARPVYADPFNGIVFAENPAEWIELHNRTATPADLGGWRFSGGLDYLFPAGTVLAPGGFLVVNNTQFSGTLANSSDLIRLRDTADEIVDEVRYFDSGRWPRAADGGGVTLELKDPAADNRRAESWAASDESGKSAWQTVTYRATGAEPPGSNNPAKWREFLFGLLDEGECLIDDVSVIEDPAGVKLQLIQNGTFESDTVGGGAAHWRLMGTHKLSRVQADPDNPGGGKVLHLIATGEHEHTYNNASTTLAGNRAISNTKTYEISYRAKWISGSPQLNSRLYLNRAARTTILSQPAAAGTPGAPNSRLLANAAPVFENLRHSPLVPAAGQPVRVSVYAADPDGLQKVRLFYSPVGQAWKSVVMGGDSTGSFYAVLPGQALNVLIRFYVEATDAKGAVSFFPAAGPDSRALYRTGDGGVSTQPVKNKMRLMMTPADAAVLHNPIHGVSNFRWPSTVIYNDREVWYDARVRLRSAPYGRQGNRAGWNIQFGGDAPFRGVQKSVVIDGAYNMPKTDGTGWLETVLGPSVNEMLYQVIAGRAGNIPSTRDDIVFFQTPRASEGNRRAQLKMTRYGSGFLEEFIPDGEDTLLFKQELIYYPTDTVDGKPESLKNPYSAVLDTEIRSFGTSRDSYRFNWLPQNHQDRDDFSGLMALGAAFGSPAATLQAKTDAVMDTENWMRVYALTALTGLADTYNSGLAHNIVVGIRPRDGKAMLFPWDQDHAFYYAANSPIFGGGTHRLAAVIQLPANRRRYCAHLLDLCSTAFTSEHLDPVITHLTTVAGKPAHGAAFKSWITRRRTYVQAEVRKLYPATVPFAITTQSGAAFSTAESFAVLEGTGSIDVRGILLSRNGGAASAAEITWLDGRRWRVTLPLLNGANAFTLTAADSAGGVLGIANTIVTHTGPAEAATAKNLVISEIHYHPSAGDRGGEFIELLNAGDRPVDLTGVRFTAGIAFDFTGGAVLSLPPGQRVLVVENVETFTAKHGAGLPVAGAFSTFTKLSNSGERITLTDRGGGVIADFEYGTADPWPEDADGAGYSLTLMNPGAGQAFSDGAQWRISRAAGGSPGGSDALKAEDFPSLTGYALTAPPQVSVEGSSRRIIWNRRIGADAVRIIPETSDSLTNWQPDSGDGSRLLILSSEAQADGSVRVTAELPEVPQTPGASRFFRLRIERR